MGPYIICALLITISKAMLYYLRTVEKLPGIKQASKQAGLQHRPATMKTLVKTKENGRIKEAYHKSFRIIIGSILGGRFY